MTNFRMRPGNDDFKDLPVLGTLRKMVDATSFRPYHMADWGM